MADKFDNKTRVLLRKLSGAAAVIGFLIVIRELGWRDVGLWPSGFALLIMLVGTSVFASFKPTLQRGEHAYDDESRPENEHSNHREVKNTPDISVLYRLHQTAAFQNASPERALQMLAELMPDKILALYEVDGKNLAFSCGARINARQRSEAISPAEDLVEELTKRINSCMDATLLKNPERFSKPLFFSRTHESEDGMLLPVRCQAEIHAVLAVLSTASRAYEEAEIVFLRHFCGSLAILFSNQQQLGSLNDTSSEEAESRLTQRLFADMLPESARSLPGWDIAQLAGYSDAHSGDFHDYINLPGDRMLIIAGRTSIGGLNSALYLARLRAMLVCMCESCSSPADLLNKLSTRLTSDKSLDLFASLIALQIKAGERNATLAVAGHVTPLINRPRSGFVEIPQLDAGVPMGLFNQGVDPYQNQVIQLLPGDGILIYTDGAIDFAGGKGSRLGSEDLRLLLDKMPEQYADDLLANLADQLIPSCSRERPLEDYTFIYASTE